MPPRLSSLPLSGPAGDCVIEGVGTEGASVGTAVGGSGVAETVGVGPNPFRGSDTGTGTDRAGIGVGTGVGGDGVLGGSDVAAGGGATLSSEHAMSDTPSSMQRKSAKNPIWTRINNFKLCSHLLIMQQEVTLLNGVLYNAECETNTLDTRR